MMSEISQCCNEWASRVKTLRLWFHFVFSHPLFVHSARPSRSVPSRLCAHQEIRHSAHRPQGAMTRSLNRARRRQSPRLPCSKQNPGVAIPTPAGSGTRRPAHSDCVAVVTGPMKACSTTMDDCLDTVQVLILSPPSKAGQALTLQVFSEPQSCQQPRVSD